MKKITILLFIFSLFYGFDAVAQCDCMSYHSAGDIFSTKKGITQKNYQLTFRNNKRVISFAIILEKNKKYTFETYDKKGKRTERIKVTIVNSKREFIRNNIDSLGNIKERFFLYPPEEAFVYMELSVLEPEYSNCTCAYVIMFIDDL